MNTQVSARERSASAEAPDYAMLQTELTQLRTQIETIVKDVTASGRAKLQDVEDQTSAMVRDRPIQSLAIALGLGFLLALLYRR